MEWDTLVDVFMSIGGPLAEHFHSLSTGDILTSTFALLSFSYAIYLKWKTAESRINKRLLQHLSNEEERLEGVRNSLADQLMRHNPGMVEHLPNDAPPSAKKKTIYTNRALEKALKKLNWKKPERAKKQLEKILVQVDHRVVTATESTELHKKQKAAAHLLLGAIAATQKEDWQDALAEFEAVLELNPNDAEALEYAGFQLLKMGSKQQAIDYFRRLQNVAQSEANMILFGRACRHEAFAWAMKPNPMRGNARDALNKAIANIPDTELFERAITYELIGNLQKQAGHIAAASTSYKDALVRFTHLGSSRVGKEGKKRMAQALTNANLPPDGDNNQQQLNNLQDVQGQVLYQMGPSSNSTIESSTETSPSQRQTLTPTPEPQLTN